jgi:hypothetical protein
VTLLYSYRTHAPRKAYCVAFQSLSAIFSRRSLRVVGSLSRLLADPAEFSFSCSLSNLVCDIEGAVDQKSAEIVHE